MNNGSPTSVAFNTFPLTIRIEPGLVEFGEARVSSLVKRPQRETQLTFLYSGAIAGQGLRIRSQSSWARCHPATYTCSQSGDVFNCRLVVDLFGCLNEDNPMVELVVETVVEERCEEQRLQLPVRIRFIRDLPEGGRTSELSVEPSHLDLGDVALEHLLTGGGESVQFHVTNSGQAPLTEVVVCPVRWLRIDPLRWRIQPEETQAVTVQLEPTGLHAGLRRTELHFPNHNHRLAVSATITSTGPIPEFECPEGPLPPIPGGQAYLCTMKVRNIGVGLLEVGVTWGPQGVQVASLEISPQPETDQPTWEEFRVPFPPSADMELEVPHKVELTLLTNSHLQGYQAVSHTLAYTITSPREDQDLKPSETFNESEASQDQGENDMSTGEDSQAVQSGKDNTSYQQKRIPYLWMIAPLLFMVVLSIVVLLMVEIWGVTRPSTMIPKITELPTLNIQADPVAKVFLNGIEQGYTPMHLTKVQLWATITFVYEYEEKGKKKKKRKSYQVTHAINRLIYDTEQDSISENRAIYVGAHPWADVFVNGSRTEQAPGWLEGVDIGATIVLEYGGDRISFILEDLNQRIFFDFLERR